VSDDVLYDRFTFLFVPFCFAQKQQKHIEGFWRQLNIAKGVAIERDSRS